MRLPKDIIQKVLQDFESCDKEYVIKELESRFSENKNFWAINVIRAVLYLSNGSLKQFNEWLGTDDSRTILFHAEKKSGDYGHYFKLTFDEIAKLIDITNTELITQIQEQDNLPPE